MCLTRWDFHALKVLPARWNFLLCAALPNCTLQSLGSLALCKNVLATVARFGEIVKKADSTLRSSQAVPHPSTNRALCRLTSEVRRDPVHSTRYGRQRKRYLEWCLEHRRA